MWIYTYQQHALPLTVAAAELRKVRGLYENLVGSPTIFLYRFFIFLTKREKHMINFVKYYFLRDAWTILKGVNPD